MVKSTIAEYLKDCAASGIPARETTASLVNWPDTFSMTPKEANELISLEAVFNKRQKELEQETADKKVDMDREITATTAYRAELEVLAKDYQTAKDTEYQHKVIKLETKKNEEIETYKIKLDNNYNTKKVELEKKSFKELKELKESWKELEKHRELLEKTYQDNEDKLKEQYETLDAISAKLEKNKKDLATELADKVGKYKNDVEKFEKKHNVETAELEKNKKDLETKTIELAGKVVKYENDVKKFEKKHIKLYNIYKTKKAELEEEIKEFEEHRELLEKTY